VFRLLAHPRFRAAFDFLSLRTAASSDHAQDVEFWREAQQQPGDVLAAQLDGQAMHDDEEAAPRRRRRRRRGGSAAAGE
jgi:poly(A) polymerase